MRTRRAFTIAVLALMALGWPAQARVKVFDVAFPTRIDGGTAIFGGAQRFAIDRCVEAVVLWIEHKAVSGRVGFYVARDIDDIPVLWKPLMVAQAADSIIPVTPATGDTTAVRSYQCVLYRTTTLMATAVRAYTSPICIEKLRIGITNTSGALRPMTSISAKLMVYYKD